MTRQHGRRDNNHVEIVSALLLAGYFTVGALADLGNGVPDILCCSKSGLTILFEVKSPGEGLTPDEKRFHLTYPGRLDIVHSAEEALATMALLDEMRAE